MTSCKESSTHLPEVNIVSSEYWCHTKLKVIKLSQMWTIDNLSFSAVEKGEMVYSSTFPAGDNEKVKCRMFMCPKADDPDYLSVYVNVTSCDKSEVKGKFRFSILNANKEEVNVVEAPEAVNFVSYHNFGYYYFISRNYLFNKVNGLVIDDKLTIICEVKLVVDSVNITGRSDISHYKLPECKLVEDLSHLHNNKKFCDVTLIADGREFHGHKAILSARSDVFAAMFEDELQEHKMNRIVITDINCDVFGEMLHFIYTGNAPNLNNKADELLAAADKYALNKLKVMCEMSLGTRLSIETAVKTLILADFYNAQQLKAHALHFIKTNAVDIIETQDWQIMSTKHPHLIVEAFRALALDGNDSNIIK